ncbi:MAG: hypothetical protein LBI33_07850 [Propionibacteriaceae bacterium]|jgi:antitoxin component of RelBE/YafQ-DinJ toxin-antitoxin module|nr:hypothetical protein [Propionibacteriaceae bacterium]
MASTTTLTIRLDSDIKDAARRRAQRLGVSLATLVENDLRRFINGYPIIIDDDSFVPSERLREDIAAARDDEANGDYATITADNLDEFFDNVAKVRG